jgi:hypothetical protein
MRREIKNIWTLLPCNIENWIVMVGDERFFKGDSLGGRRSPMNLLPPMRDGQNHDSLETHFLRFDS